MVFSQQIISIRTQGRGYYLVTGDIERALKELNNYKTGIAHLFLMHTSASLTINENADPTVRDDFRAFEEALVPRDFPYRHDYEGSDDMPAHIKSSLFGNTLSLPITNGRLALGTWQGIYLNEHRDHGSMRNITCTLYGECYNI